MIQLRNTLRSDRAINAKVDRLPTIRLRSGREIPISAQIR